MFDGIFEAIEEWMRELLTGMVTSNLTEMFSDVNEKTGEIAILIPETKIRISRILPFCTNKKTASIS